jgi:hypothetical protein
MTKRFYVALYSIYLKCKQKQLDAKALKPVGNGHRALKNRQTDLEWWRGSG